MKILKRILLLILVVFIMAQFFSPEKNEGTASSIIAFLEETNPPEEVKLILKESCYDCHSSITKYPWYNAITPINYWMADHIKNGSKHLNFSKWDDYTVKKKDHKLDEVIEMVENNEMPLPSYTWVHGDAKLNDIQKRKILTWAKQMRQSYKIESKP